MALKAPQASDPMALVGVALDGDPTAAEEMARCLVEEFLRQGWDEARLLALFRNPFYQALHMIYRARGEEAVRALIAEIAAAWGVWVVREADGGKGGVGDA